MSVNQVSLNGVPVDITKLKAAIKTVTKQDDVTKVTAEQLPEVLRAADIQADKISGITLDAFKTELTQADAKAAAAKAFINKITAEEADKAGIKNAVLDKIASIAFPNLNGKNPLAEDGAASIESAIKTVLDKKDGEDKKKLEVSLAQAEAKGIITGGDGKFNGIGEKVKERFLQIQKSVEFVTNESNDEGLAKFRSEHNFDPIQIAFETTTNKDVVKTYFGGNANNFILFAARLAVGTQLATKDAPNKLFDGKAISINTAGETPVIKIGEEVITPENAQEKLAKPLVDYVKPDASYVTAYQTQSASDDVGKPLDDKSKSANTFEKKVADLEFNEGKTSAEIELPEGIVAAHITAAVKGIEGITIEPDKNNAKKITITAEEKVFKDGVLTIKGKAGDGGKDFNIELKVKSAEEEAASDASKGKDWLGIGALVVGALGVLGSFFASDEGNKMKSGIGIIGGVLAALGVLKLWPNLIVSDKKSAEAPAG